MYVSHERRAYILRLLQQRGTLRTSELAEELEVTDETIRTDLVALQAQGLLQRIHGGARYLLPQGGSEDGTRLDCQLADLLRPHLRSGMRVYLDAAETALALLAALSGESAVELTLILPCPELLHRLNTGALPHLMECPGGTLERDSGLLRRADMPAALGALDLALLCPPALRPNEARYPHALAAEWASAASAAARRTLIVIPAAATAPVAVQAAPHAAPLHRALLLTEDALPPDFDDMPAETVPALTAADILPQNEY